MKTELIEYHRRYAKNVRDIYLRANEGSPLSQQCEKELAFHERAVVWLESLKDDLTMKTAAHIHAGQQMEATATSWQYPVLTAEQADEERKRKEATP